LLSSKIADVATTDNGYTKHCDMCSFSTIKNVVTLSEGSPLDTYVREACYVACRNVKQYIIKNNAAPVLSNGPTKTALGYNSAIKY